MVNSYFKIMNGVRSMLACNNRSYIFEKQLRISNIGLGKFTTVKINMELNYNSI